MPLDQAAMFISQPRKNVYHAAQGIDPRTARARDEKEATGPSDQVCHFLRRPAARARNLTQPWRAIGPCEVLREIGMGPLTLRARRIWIFKSKIQNPNPKSWILEWI